MVAAGFNLAAAVLAAACASCTSINPHPDVLEGSDWRVTAINQRPTPAEPGNYRIRFRDGQIGGQFGCNHFGGPYRVRGDVMTTGAVAMTEMACTEPANTFESWGLAIIAEPMRLSFGDQARSLTLTNARGTIELARMP